MDDTREAAAAAFAELDRHIAAAESGRRPPDPKPERPWRRRKRTWLAFAAWLSLPVLYPLGAGPVAYALDMGWLARGGFGSAYLYPLARAPAPLDGLI